jgi:hypothetical protein
MPACTIPDEKPLRDLVIGAMGQLTEQFPHVATRIAELANQGWLENHQTAGSLNQVAQELLGKLQGAATTDAD